jgi:hypothetical protein
MKTAAPSTGCPSPVTTIPETTKAAVDAMWISTPLVV